MNDREQAYRTATATLYRAPLSDFVETRKRLAAELKASDKDGATRLAKLARPSISAWVVNQLWWQERENFEELLASAEQLRSGDRRASAVHRDLSAKLRARAAELLEAAGNAASEPTLRRVSATLAAIAAAGGFAPDPPGALSADRDAPGFAAFGASEASRPANDAPLAASAPKTAAPTPSARAHEEAAAAEAQAAEEQRREQAEQLRLQQAEQARRRAEHARLQAAVSDAKTQVTTREVELERSRRELSSNERKLELARLELAELERKLANL
jgi:hypothetical protein